MLREVDIRFRNMAPLDQKTEQKEEWTSQASEELIRAEESVILVTHLGLQIFVLFPWKHAKAHDSEFHSAVLQSSCHRLSQSEAKSISSEPPGLHSDKIDQPHVHAAVHQLAVPALQLMLPDFCISFMLILNP